MTHTAPPLPSGREDELQAITAQMVRLIAEQQHLLCAQLAPPLQGALIERLASALPQCFVLRVMSDAPGRLLAGVLAAVGIGGVGNDTSGPRRDLALRLSSAQQRGQAIVLLLGGAEYLSDEDAALLLHFFPAGATSVVLAGAGDAADWAPCRQALAAGAKVHACVYRDVAAGAARSPEPTPPPAPITPAPEVPTDPARAAPPVAAAPPLLNLRVEPRAAADGVPPRQGRTHRHLERRLRRWRSLALLEAVLVLGLAALLVEPHLRSPDDGLAPPAPAQMTAREAPPAMASPPPEMAVERLAPPEPPATPSVSHPPEASADPTPPDAAPAPSTPSVTVPEEESKAQSPEVAPPPASNDAVDAAPSTPLREPAPQTPSTAPPAPRRAPEYEPQTTGVAAPTPSPEAIQEAERYAERAEQELHRGQLAAAGNSIARGLALDPRNLHLLDLQVVLRSARSPNAPPLPGAP